MEKKSFLVVALALWLIAAALAGLSPSARALPNHVVTGGVYGPGNNVQPGPANPANPASAVYYSTTQPTYPVLVETDITDADGTLPASFATDVGASWSWLPGDEVVVVVETVRGVNGWAAVNYTTSVDGVLATGSIQDIGSGTAEQDPPLTLISGSTDINVTWRALTDTNANVRSYIVFRGPGPLGPFTPIGTVTHAGSASLYQDDMGLAPGTYCYQLAINYRRDTTGGTYTTLGRSETACTSITGAPRVTYTSPANGATGVPRSATVIVRFSEAMSSATIAFTPLVTGVVQTLVNGNTELRVTHNPFAAGTAYQAQVSGQDTTGNNLEAGSLPNPWSFTANVPPTATIIAPGVGVCRTGGSSLPITWTMADTETSTGALRAWLNYTDGITTNAIAGPLTGLSSPATYTWSTPVINADVTILLEVADGAGEKAQDTSASVRIDSTAPTVSNSNPADLAVSTPTDAPIWLNFSEAMNVASVQTAFSITPSVAGVTFAWSNGNRSVRVSHTDLFVASTQYTARIGTGARDDCTPGMTLASAYTLRFTTGLGPAQLRPKPPTNVAVTATSSTSITLTWTAPTEYTDGQSLAAGDIVGYDVYRSDSATGTRTKVGTDVTGTSFTDTNVPTGATFYYWVKAKHRGGLESDFSASATGTTGAAGINTLFIGLIVIAILAVIGAILLLRRRKQKPVQAPPEEAPPLEPPGEGDLEDPGGGTL